MSVPFASSISNVEVIRTNTFLDKITGIGGIPRGRITEIFGDPSVGKSTVSFQMIAEAQKQGMKCLFVDIEWSYEAKYAESLGVDNKKLGLIRERFAEDALDAIEKELDDGKWDLVVLDSIGGLLPRQEAEKTAGEKVIGGQASLVARFCRKAVPLLALRDTALLVLNHSFIDLLSGKIMTSGGAKLSFHKSLSIRLKVNPTVAIKQGDKKVGKVIVAEVRKNKLAATEGMIVDAKIMFGAGFSASEDLLGDALDAGVITKKGNTHYFSQEKLGMISAVREWMKVEENAEKVKAALV